MSQGDPASRTDDSDAASEQSFDDIDRRPDDTPVDAPRVRTTTRQKAAAAAAARLGGRDSSASESEDEEEEVAEDVPTTLAPTPLVTLGGDLKAAADKIEKDEKMQFQLYFGTLFDVWALFAHRDAMLELKCTCAEPYVLDSDFAKVTIDFFGAVPADAEPAEYVAQCAYVLDDKKRFIEWVGKRKPGWTLSTRDKQIYCCNELFLMGPKGKSLNLRRIDAIFSM